MLLDPAHSSLSLTLPFWLGFLSAFLPTLSISLIYNFFVELKRRSAKQAFFRAQSLVSAYKAPINRINLPRACVLLGLSAHAWLSASKIRCPTRFL